MDEKPQEALSAKSPVQVETRRIDDPLERQRHTGDGMVVESRLSLGVRPTLELSWGVLSKFWKSKLAIFHNRTGFCPEDFPDDLNRHGQLIIETIRNGKKTLYLEEGAHFYTVVLHKPHFIPILGNYRSKPLKLFIDVPSAKTVLGRIKDQQELLHTEHEMNVAALSNEAEMNEAEIKVIESRQRLKRARNPQPPPQPKHQKPSHPNPTIAAEFNRIDEQIEALIAKKIKRQEILENPDFQKLSPEDQAAVLEELDERLDPGEVSARQEREQS